MIVLIKAFNRCAKLSRILTKSSFKTQCPKLFLYYYSTTANSNSKHTDVQILEKLKKQAFELSSTKTEFLKAKEKYLAILSSPHYQSLQADAINDHTSVQLTKTQVEYAQCLTNLGQYDQIITIFNPICLHIDTILQQSNQLNQDGIKSLYSQCYIKFAQAHIDRGQIQIGVQKYMTAISVSQRLLGQTHSDTLSQKVKFAKKLQVLKTQKPLRLKLYSQVRDVFIQKFGMKSKQALQLRSITLQLLLELFRGQQSKRQIKQLVSDVQQVLPQLNQTRLATQKLEALLSHDDKDFQKCQKLFQNLLQKLSAEDDTSIIDFYIKTVQSYSQCLRACNKTIKGQTILQQAIQRIQKIRAPQSPQLLNLKFNHTVGIQILGYRDQALKNYKQIKDLYLLKDKNHVSQNYINNQIKLITLLIMTQRLSQANQLNQIVIKQVKQHFPSQKYCIQRARLNTAMILYLQKDFTQAQKIVLQINDEYFDKQSEEMKKKSGVYQQVQMMLNIFNKKKN